MKNFFAKIKASKAALISLAAVGGIAAVFVALTVYAYSYGGIFPGVSAGDIPLSGKSETEAAELLNASCAEKYDDAEIVVAVEEFERIPVSASELKITFPAEEIASRAYATGREGGLFPRLGHVLKGMFGGVDVGLTVAADEDSLLALMEKVSKYDVEPVDATYTIEDDTLLLHPRHDGKKVNAEKFKERLLTAFAEEDYSEIRLEREVAEAVALDIDKVYSEVHTEVKDAYLEKTEEGNKIVPHVVGVDFDLEAARAAYNKTPDEVVRIPLTITEPKVYTKHFEVNMFKYCLSEVETHFSPKKVERTANVRLAAKLVNGTILNPGEEFSYNKVVGPRTTERGFRAAAIFAQGEVVDGVGGGICQVSSTIYMAALRANMKITERRNHAFYVDYTPKGEDATVVYGSIDFRFKNTSEYPIKIVATSKNNYIRIQLMGTEPDEKVTVKLTKKTHSQTPYPTREKSTTALKAGERKVDQKGQEGLSMSVYRNVYDKNGKLIESYLENNSKYKPMPEIVLVGTGASEPAVAPAPEEPAAPTPEEPVAPAPVAPTPEAPAEPTPAPAPEVPETEPTVPDEGGEVVETDSEPGGEA